MASEMPVVNAEFGDRPTIEFPTEIAPAGLKVVELFEGNGPMVRRGDTVTVNYHGVVWGKDTPFDSSFDRHQPATFGIGVGQVIKGWDQTVPGHNVGSRLVVSIPPEYGYGSRGVPQAGAAPCRRSSWHISLFIISISFLPASAARTRWCS